MKNRFRNTFVISTSLMLALGVLPVSAMETEEETGIPISAIEVIGPADMICGYANYTLYSYAAVIPWEAVRDAKLDDRLAGVERRLDEHNRYAERFSAIQTDLAVIKNDIKTLYKSKE